MDPSNPVPRRRDPMSLSQVQQWVASTLVVTTILHLAIGFVVAAYFARHGGATPQVGLLVIAAVVGVLAVAAGFLIHRRSPVSPWLITGLLPAAVGAWLIFGR